MTINRRALLSGLTGVAAMLPFERAIAQALTEGGAADPIATALETHTMPPGWVKPDQIAMGRGPKDPVRAITRLQTCLTPSGHVGVSASTLVGEERRAKESSGSAVLRRLLRLGGIEPSRHECLAVQVASGTPGERALLAAWRDVQEVMLVP